ncbi:MAG: ankyrin repeat domain-containing protein [Verrucomicrobia bacterium]|nr:ankyrin repeat domain-containing protein [Verrucomicrobiota bacterium]
MNSSVSHYLRLLPVLVALPWALLADSATPADPHGPATELHRAIQRGDQTAWRRLIREGADVMALDASGNMPIHLAAQRGGVDCVLALLDHGADANATNHLAETPLILGAADVEVVRALLEHDANPNAVCTKGRTPLFSAARGRQSFEAVSLLIKAGARVELPAQGRMWNPLMAAIRIGNPRTIDLLIAEGATLEAVNNGYSPLLEAAIDGDLRTVKRLVEAGADLDYSYEAIDPAGSALNSAMWAGQQEVAAYLIDQGADLHKASTMGSKTPPMVWAGYGQFGDPTLARKMIAKGLDVNTTNAVGETALFYALKTGPDTELVRYLRSVGAKEPEDNERKKVLPSRPVPADGPERSTMIRDGSQRAIDLMRSSSEVFLKGRDCASCHHQLLPPLAYSMALQRGLHVDALALGHQLAEQLSGGSIQGGRRGLVALDALGYAPDALTAVAAQRVRNEQNEKGTWFDYGRPPLEDSAWQEVAWAVRAIKAFPVPGDEKATAESVERALDWLRREQPATLNERNFQLLALHWGGEPPEKQQKQVHALLKEQRPDGGWAQLPTLESDAWATGQALYALHEAGGLATDDPAYRRGVDFLLRTQFEDGSWWVKNRTWPFQPHFDSGFPHGKDQWISIGGTVWATMALLATIEPVKSRDVLQTGQQLVAQWKESQTTDASRPATGDSETFVFHGTRTVDFKKDIRPILENSCVDCHSGDKPKGGFKMVNRASLMKGGESGVATFAPGRGAGSQLIRHVTDQVEDMEMPPLNKRKTYPALTPGQVRTLITWINEGAEWPEGMAFESGNE